MPDINRKEEKKEGNNSNRADSWTQIKFAVLSLKKEKSRDVASSAGACLKCNSTLSQVCCRRCSVKGDRWSRNRAVLPSILLLIIGSGPYRRGQRRRFDVADAGEARNKAAVNTTKRTRRLLGKSKYSLFSRNLQCRAAGTPEALWQRKKSPTWGRRWRRWRRSGGRGRKGFERRKERRKNRRRKNCEALY